MKKFYLLPTLALSTMLAVTSCSSDDVPDVVTGDETSFAVQLPADLASRAFGDGQSATTLTYAIYEHGSANPILMADGKNTGTATFTNLKTTVKMNLPRGKHYDIIFWAQNPAAPYTFSAADRNVKVTYQKGYSENNDAFCYILKDFVVNTATTQEVTLYRPFAQLNIGTTDYAEATGMKLTATESAVTVNGVATTFDFTKGEQGEAVVDPTAPANAEFELAPIPADTENFPVTDPANIKYMAMNYILVPGDKTTTSVTFKVNDPSYTPFTFENVPFQRNYRTNIYGQLLTAPATFNVTIDPIFNEFKDAVVWDGTAVEPEGFNLGMPENKIVYLNEPGELAWVIEKATVGNENFKGYTFVLTRDFDMNGNTLKGYSSFKGTLDGQGHTIKGLANRLFSTVDGGTVRNLIIDSANITSGGSIASSLTGNGLIENITVNDNCTFKGYSDMGAIVGSIGVGRVNKCVNNADITGNTHIGGIVGWSRSATVTNCENHGNITSNTTGKAEGIGGVIGQQLYGGSVMNCTNTGDVSVNSTNVNTYGAGGIIGWIRYSTGSSWTNRDFGVNNVVEVSGCSNSGKIYTNKTGAGGIVGIAYVAANVHDNTNTSTSIKADVNFASGIVGGYQYDPKEWSKNSYFPYLPENLVGCTVNNNVSTSTREQVTGPNSAPYCYNNNPTYCTVENNTGADW